VDDVLRLVGDLVDRVLGLAGRPIGLALALQVLVAGEIAGGLLDAPLGLVRIRHVLLLCES
jgi:hypothetical protein